MSKHRAACQVSRHQMTYQLHDLSKAHRFIDAWYRGGNLAQEGAGIAVTTVHT